MMNNLAFRSRGGEERLNGKLERRNKKKNWFLFAKRKPEDWKASTSEKEENIKRLQVE